MKRVFGFGALLAIVLSVSGCLCGRGGPGLGCNAVGEQCSTHGDCCSFGCGDGVCRANPMEGGICATSSDCVNGRRCENQACVDGCRPPDDVCRSNYDCCSGSCSIAAGANEGTCIARTTCGEQGQGCTTSNDCCAGLQCPSNMNTCQPAPCSTTGAACTASNDCCASLGCQNGTSCQAGCRASGGTCAGDNDCCSGNECRNGVCYSSSSCGRSYDNCDDEGDCCTQEGYRCQANGECGKGSLGQACSDVSQCGSGLICDQGICHYPASSCGTSGWSTCAINADCCTSVAAGPGTASCELPTDGGITGTCCLPGETACTSGGMDCCGDSVCLSTTSKCGACLTPGTFTNSYGDCCSAKTNWYTDTCCNDMPSACTSPSQCCSNRCGSDGQCCTPEGSSCTAEAGTQGTCCAGSACQPSYPGSSYRSCQINVGGACTTDYCADPATCFKGTCCQDVGATCDGNNDCCSGVCGGDLKCAAAAPGGSCRIVGDCGGSPANTCTASNTCCRNLGAACTGDTDCCTATGVTCGGAATGGLRCCLPAGANGTAQTCCNGVTGAGKCQ